MTRHSVRWTQLDDADQVAEQAVERITATARQAIAERGRFHLVLAGGRTPAVAYERLRSPEQDWSRWRVFFGDERCLPIGHPERNSTMAHRTLLDHVPIPANQIHPIAAERGPESGADAYGELIASYLPFDLVLLGMGEDGHTASLFPEQPIDPNALTIAVHGAPKPPPERVSLGVAALQRTSRLLFLVTGADKRDAVRRWRSGEELPVAEVAGLTETEVLIVRTAMPAAD